MSIFLWFLLPSGIRFPSFARRSIGVATVPTSLWDCALRTSGPKRTLPLHRGYAFSVHVEHERVCPDLCPTKEYEVCRGHEQAIIILRTVVTFVALSAIFRIWSQWVCCSASPPDTSLRALSLNQFLVAALVHIMIRILFLMSKTSLVLASVNCKWCASTHICILRVAFGGDSLQAGVGNIRWVWIQARSLHSTCRCLLTFLSLDTVVRDRRLDDVAQPKCGRMHFGYLRPRFRRLPHHLLSVSFADRPLPDDDD